MTKHVTLFCHKRCDIMCDNTCDNILVCDKTYVLTPTFDSLSLFHLTHKILWKSDWNCRLPELLPEMTRKRRHFRFRYYIRMTSYPFVNTNMMLVRIFLIYKPNFIANELRTVDFRGFTGKTRKWFRFRILVIPLSYPCFKVPTYQILWRLDEKCRFYS